MRMQGFTSALAVCGLAALAGCPLGADRDLDCVTPPTGRVNSEFDDGCVGPVADDDAPRPGNDGAPRPGYDEDPGTGDFIPLPGGIDIPAITVPAELAGQWTTILTYIPAYYTGDHIDLRDFSGSLGVYYYFGADAQYRYDLNVLKAAGFCYFTSSWTEYGTFSVDGSEVSLNPVRATHVVTDTCGESVLDDNAPTTGSTFSFTPEQDAAGWPMLRLLLPSGEELLLEKCRDCQ